MAFTFAFVHSTLVFISEVYVYFRNISYCGYWINIAVQYRSQGIQEWNK